ncbi:hypothetical protein O9992_25175 [Vibrio lentus]|nr:hypothetical protein [Vibrio lentus]
MSASFKGADRFSPISYKRRVDVIRDIACVTGTVALHKNWPEEIG